LGCASRARRQTGCAHPPRRFDTTSRGPCVSTSSLSPPLARPDAASRPTLPALSLLRPFGSAPGGLLFGGNSVTRGLAPGIVRRLPYRSADDSLSWLTAPCPLVRFQSSTCATHPLVAWQHCAAAAMETTVVVGVRSPKKPVSVTSLPLSSIACTGSMRCASVMGRAYGLNLSRLTRGFIIPFASCSAFFMIKLFFFFASHTPHHDPRLHVSIYFYLYGK
jgi:hypothetical protein